MVHGTGATGPEKGSSWWQRGSFFEEDLSALVDADGTGLKFEHIIWDGYNSEMSRFAASEALRNRLLTLERQDENYCLLGHSHGGSVVASALLNASKQGHPLRHLRRWITVGTPYIETRRQFALFSRLKPWARAGYLLFLFTAITWTSFAISLLFSELDNPAFDRMVLFGGPSLLAVLYLILLLSQPKKVKLYGFKLPPEAAQTLLGKWFPLYHLDDEALNALHLVRSAKISLFDTNFAVPALSFMSLISVPILMYALSQWTVYEDFAAQVGTWVSLAPTPKAQLGRLEAFARENLSVIAYPTIHILHMLEWVGISPNNQAAQSRMVLGFALFAGTLGGLFGLWLASILINLLVVVLAQYISSALSWLLNRMTHTRIRTISLGGDALGEEVIAADSAPGWVGGRGKPLPEDLANEISHLSDAAAAEALKRIRTQIATLALAGDGNMLNFLTWRELVHTSYFYVPGFRKLIAYIISQSTGFRASRAFTQDPDYHTVAGWYAQLAASAGAQGSNYDTTRA
ncbi:hypothetical protein [Microvirga zambiensis]|uniref:hypothetical protein n=1 Tax=Microvirga zambiensis TaxID=1402137 RepID=UPI00191EFD12|nr:hypothetical protein [Microvirga zambiensis]